MNEYISLFKNIQMESFTFLDNVEQENYFI